MPRGQKAGGPPRKTNLKGLVKNSRRNNISSGPEESDPSFDYQVSEDSREEAIEALPVSKDIPTKSSRQIGTTSFGEVGATKIVKWEKNVDATTINLFKDFHCSQKAGFSEPIEKATGHMKAIMDKPV